METTDGFDANRLLFLRSFLARPRKVASIVPSGPQLAAAVAKQIEPAPGGLVVELGPGTGTVTRALLDRGVAPKDLVVIESDSDFVALLRRHFARIEIVEGDAFDFGPLLLARGHVRPLAAVVSGLPVLSEPLATRQKLLRSALDALGAGKPFVQFSYGFRPPIPPLDGIEVRRGAVVWRNVPPMHVWVYRRKG